MAEELRVQISAETKELSKALRKSEKELDGFGKKVTSSGNTTNKFSKQVKGNAVPAMQEFSRVIQDAPFGIQGVANNITQLTTQFGNLSTKLGGSKAALKAMLGTLAGPAGILLAVSAVTSLLVSFGDELKNAVSGTNALNDATKDFTASAQNEISKLNQLVKIARDENQSKQVRERAIKAINKDYSKYLGNLDLESVKTQAVTNKINSLSKALLIKAKIRGAEAVLEEKFKKLAEKTNEVIEQSGVTARNNATERIRNAKREKQALESLLVSLQAQKAEGKDVSAAITDVSNKIKLLEQTASLANFEQLTEGFLSDRIKTETADIQQEINQFESVLKGFLQDSFGELDLDVEVAPKFKFKKEKELPVLKGKGFGIDFGEDFESGLKQQLALDVQASQLAYGKILANQVAFEEQYKASLARINEETNLKTSLVSSAFTTLGQNISSALAQTQGVFGAFVGTIIQESLKLVQQLIINSIKGAAATKAAAAAQIVAAKSAAVASAIQAGTATAAASGPGAAFVLPGLIAGAIAAVSAAFSGIGGGGASGGVGGSGSVNNNSAVSTSFGGGLGSGNQRVVFEISGRKLVGVLQNEFGAAARINGNGLQLG